MEDERASYLLMVRAEPGVDAIRALRAWLKMGLRAFGLRCVEVREELQTKEAVMAIDMRQYASTYIKPDNVRDGPIQTRIINVFESGQTGRPVLELETGSQFTLNDGNTNTLIKAWGYNSDDWIGQEIELFLGTYKDWKSDPPADKETVKVRAVPSAKTAAGNSGTASKPPLPPGKTASRKDDLSDEVPF
jgi:hypothetical protein